MKLTISLLIGLLTSIVSAAQATEQQTISIEKTNDNPSVCHVDYVKKIGLKGVDKSVLGDCEKGEVLSIYMGGLITAPNGSLQP